MTSIVIKILTEEHIIINGSLTYGTKGDRCFLKLNFLNFNFESTNTDYFSCFLDVREKMFPSIPLCKGSRYDVYPSAMSQQMSLGITAYIQELGKHPKNTINIFDEEINSEKISTVEKQLEYRKIWYQSNILNAFNITYEIDEDDLVLDRFKGSLFGLACGDALGTTLEFKPYGSFEPITDIVGGGVFNLERGQWTDDTSMALCLAESFLETKKFDTKQQMDYYVRWYQYGYLSSTGKCFDIGISVRKALENYIKTGEPISGSTDDFSAGNGSLMRLVPVSLFYFNHYEMVLKMGVESSRTTHQAKEVLDACLYFSSLMYKALHGFSKEKILESLSINNEFWVSNLAISIKNVGNGSYKEKQPPIIKGSGYVVDSLEASLWAFYNSNTFEEGALLAVNLGDDADTTGAIYGQLAGAFYGYKKIPKQWIDSIYHSDIIEAYAKGLFLLSFNDNYFEAKNLLKNEKNWLKKFKEKITNSALYK